MDELGASVHAERLPGDDALLLVRLHGRWLLTPGDRRNPEAATLDELLARVGPDRPRVTRDATTAGAVEATPAGRPWVGPSFVFMGEATDGGLWVTTPAGGLLLDAVDLTIIDTIDRKASVTDWLAAIEPRLPGAAHPSDIAGRMDDLIAAGVLREASGAEAESPFAQHELTVEERPTVIDYLEPAHSTTPGRGEVPVYAVWPVEKGPTLALGMVTAAARHHDGGALNEHFDIRRPEDPASFLADMADRPGPAVLLCSNYMWSLEANLALARRAKAQNPDLVVIHGGPSTPKYEDDCARFFSGNADIVDVAVRAEGEKALCEVLETLAAAPSIAALDGLAAVRGLSFRSSSGAVVRTEDRERIAALDELPSPYLTGEFDHLPAEVWNRVLNLETNRGCPYGCTFCDWGSVTLSRIRKFDLDRVTAEMQWAADQGIDVWQISDANFGILARDVEIVRRLAEIKATTGLPVALAFTVAKNTTKHLVEILEILTEAKIQPHFALSLQTRDPDTLEAINRSNISTDHYLSLAAGLRRRQLPSYADLMLGLPGQTVESFRADLQFLLDHELTARVWPTQLLPNAPMNDPAYRAEHQIEVTPDGVVTATSSYGAAEREQMLALRQANVVLEQFGLLRHVLRHLQWDHGIAATAVMATVAEVSRTNPSAYPLLNWAMRYFDLFPLPPLGRHCFMDEVRRFVRVELGVEVDSALETVFAVQTALLPEWGRTFPETIVLDHDYVAYYQMASVSLAATGDVPTPERPLATYGQGAFEVFGDPLDRCGTLGPYGRDARDEANLGDVWISGHFEMDSVLVRLLPEVAASGDFEGIVRRAAEAPAIEEDEPVVARSTPVILGRAGALGS